MDRPQIEEFYSYKTNANNEREPDKVNYQLYAYALNAYIDYLYKNFNITPVSTVIAHKPCDTLTF